MSKAYKAFRLTCAFLLLLLEALSGPGLQAAEALPLYQVDVVGQFPHDPNAFTQGLAFHEGRLYEGTGRNGQSSLRLMDLESGEILKRHNLDKRYFGEGITVLGEAIYQLTWREHAGFVYDRDSFTLQKTFFLPGEGWGITDDDEQLIVSDGTAYLRFLDPDTRHEIRRVEVRDEQGPVDRLNELEYIDGEVWANVWYENYLVRIDPLTGRVNSRVDLSGLQPQSGSADAVLNGIAWDETTQRLFVTGKLWPVLYEIKLRD
ncbi:MAG: glutaminyl-peptide cyclotransferase [Pseudomonadales bacterium]|nr:glutaminyl-peptide cyclotransferase [Pseudomonadales bacterium]